MNDAFPPFMHIIAGAILMSASAAHGTEIRCPGEINEVPTVQSPDPQWTAFAKVGVRPLDQSGIYLVINGEYGAQLPDSTYKDGKNEERVTWQFTGAQTEKFAVGCSYTGTTAILYKTVNASVRQCVATYSLLPTGRRQRLKSMICD